MGWIRCDDKLPKIGQRVDILYENSRYVNCEVFEQVDEMGSFICVKRNEDHWLGWDWLCHENLNEKYHWMPLPEPPKKQ